MPSEEPQAGVLKCSAAISARETGRQGQRALGLVEEVQSHMLQADVITYNAAPLQFRRSHWGTAPR